MRSPDTSSEDTGLIAQLVKQRKQIERRRNKALALALDLRSQHEAIEAMIDLQVAFLRAEQASWGQVAKALGVSRQAAQQRYGNSSALAH